MAFISFILQQITADYITNRYWKTGGHSCLGSVINSCEAAENLDQCNKPLLYTDSVFISGAMIERLSLLADQCVSNSKTYLFWRLTYDSHICICIAETETSIRRVHIHYQ